MYEKKTVNTDNLDGVSFRANEKSVRVGAINIIDKKECWLCGKAEITFLAAQMTDCTQNQLLWGNNFCSVSNAELNTWITVQASNGLAYMADAFNSGPSPLTSGEYIAFMFYEKDGQNSGNEKSFKPGSCTSPTIYYYSNDTPYGGSGTSTAHNYSNFTNNTAWTDYVPTPNFDFAEGKFRLVSEKVN